jgi:hypothetical protein
MKNKMNKRALSPKVSNIDLGIESYLEKKPKKSKITNPTPAEKILMDM